MLLGRFSGRLEPPLRVMICTNAFGMGVDLPDVRLVVHWQHPASVKDYLQEFGRAGQDGKSSVADTFVGDNDEGLLRFMACVRKSIVNYFGETPPSAHRSIAVRILEWLLSRSVHVRRTRFCCDQWDRVNVGDANSVIGWGAEVFAQGHHEKIRSALRRP